MPIRLFPTTLVLVLAFFLAPGPAAAQHAPGHESSHSHAPSGGHDHMAHRFDDAEAYAKRFDDPRRDAWQKPEEVLAALALKPGMAIADIGAGTGYFAVRLAKAPESPTVYAVDVEPSMIDYLKNRAEKEKLPNVVPILGDAESPKLPGPVDLVIVVDTYHHIGERPSYFRKLVGSLKPGGRLAIIDFRKDSPEGPPVAFRFEPDQITKELAEAGYALEASHDFLPRQHFLIYRRSGD